MTLTGPLGMLTHFGLASFGLTLFAAPFFVTAALQPPINTPPPTVQQFVAAMPIPKSPAGIKDFVMYNFNAGVQYAQYIEVQVKAQLALTPPPSTPTGAGAL